MSPNLNAYAERFVQSVKQGCLDHFVVFGEDLLRHLVTEYFVYHNTERPHQAPGNEPLGGLPPVGADAATISLAEATGRAAEVVRLRGGLNVALDISSSSCRRVGSAAKAPLARHQP